MNTEIRRVIPKGTWRWTPFNEGHCTYRDIYPGIPHFVTNSVLLRKWYGGCINVCRVFHMSTNMIVPHPSPGIEDWPSHLYAEKFLHISAMRSVRADKQKIFQALTLPEYMETWLAVPGVHPGCTSVSLLEDSFLITCSSSEGAVFHIFCTYKVCRRSKVVFNWSRPNASVPSLVKIRLLGDFERSTVQVTHSGLHPFELRWHQELWESSLEKLSILF